jgi:hypothetical protein
MHKIILLMFFSQIALAASTSQIDKENLNSEHELTLEFIQVLKTFGPDAPILNGMSLYQKDILRSHKVFLGNSGSTPIGLLARGMAALYKKIEDNYKNNSMIGLIFVSSGNAISEFMVIDALLERNKNMNIAVDLIDPAYSDWRQREIVQTLFSFLSMQKYHTRIIYKIRTDDFSKLSTADSRLEENLNELFGDKSYLPHCAYYKNDEIILSVAIFDPGAEENLDAHVAYNKIRVLLGYYFKSEENKAMFISKLRFKKLKMLGTYVGNQTIDHYPVLTKSPNGEYYGLWWEEEENK